LPDEDFGRSEQQQQQQQHGANSSFGQIRAVTLEKVSSNNLHCFV
jgi:hypothetical protein